ncbi:DUF5681 domain-containing protein [Albidovulum sp.]|uniref:DUF5681 domain-containing protein n=1 Tax=Albidovulum sp. TaxID=1872424 RepID=UPI0039B8BCC9
MTQGRKGRKGGTTERPDPLTDLERAVLDEGRRRVPVRDGGETVEMSVNEIVTRKTAETAAKGSPHAQRTWFKASAEVAAREAEIKEENAGFWRKYQRTWRRAIAQAKNAGLPLPEPVPHPDDIVIDARNNISVDGPVTGAEARALAVIAEQRDAFLRQHVLDAKRGLLNRAAEREQGFGSAFLMASMCNEVLPARLRLDETGMWHRCCQFRSQTIREPLKDDTRAWKKLRMPTRRGAAAPDLATFVRLLPALGEVAADLAASAGADREIECAIDRALARTVTLARAAAPPT